MIPNSNQIKYFLFEEDFILDNLRCIPMVVRLKLDTICIKLPLKAWSRFNENERTQLAVAPCETGKDISSYRNLVLDLAKKYLIDGLGELNLKDLPGWDNPECIPESLEKKLEEFKQSIDIFQWRSLTSLQRFALLKLSRPGHESKNFVKALAEFGLFK
jgi:hypothetical protein